MLQRNVFLSRQTPSFAIWDNSDYEVQFFYLHCRLIGTSIQAHLLITPAGPRILIEVEPCHEAALRPNPCSFATCDNCLQIRYRMARGWESKSVEQQQAEASHGAPSQRPRLSPDEADRLRQIDGLRLSRSRILQQLQVSQDSRHRKVLEAALADLDTRIQALASQPR